MSPSPASLPEGRGMKQSLQFLSIWVFDIFIFPSLIHARDTPMFSPFPAPHFSPQFQPISLPPAAMGPSPLGMHSAVLQFVVQDHHVHFDKELIIAIIFVSVAAALIILSTFYACLFLRRNGPNSKSKNDQGLSPIMSRFHSSRMMGKVEFTSIEAATNNFSDHNILREGGLGCVYKAHFDEGILAAVKKLDGGQLDCIKEFENEIILLSGIEHPNIISLLGYCSHGETRFLVYELMPNGSLEEQLHGQSHGSALTWHIRLKIALNVARGLEYLHEHCSPSVIHRDLKSSNILLDSEFNAKISGFGYAEAGGSQKKGNIKLSETHGYVAPEYLLHGKLTDKSDIYAFGVILLELLMRRKPIEKLAPSQCESIVTWAMPQLTDREKLPNLVDPVIKNTMDLRHLCQVAAIAILCVQPEPSYRPLITDVLHSLIPLVPVELGGALRCSEPSTCENKQSRLNHYM